MTLHTFFWGILFWVKNFIWISSWLFSCFSKFIFPKKLISLQFKSSWADSSKMKFLFKWGVYISVKHSASKYLFLSILWTFWYLNQSFSTSASDIFLNFSEKQYYCSLYYWLSTEPNSINDGKMVTRKTFKRDNSVALNVDLL